MTKLEKARLYEKENGEKILPEERPAYHFSPYVGWLNDPNGFSRFGGEYHLFYQYNPYDVHWNSMHWGHAKSTDLLHWEYLPAAMAPDQTYDQSGVFSGSAVALADGRQMLMYTGVAEDMAQTQCLAFGNGRNYEKYENNPVLTIDHLPQGALANEFRDPKFWQEDGRWFMVAAAFLEGEGGTAQLFRSLDGLNWKRAMTLAASKGEYGAMWECPDFFRVGNRLALMVSAIGLEKTPELPLEGSHPILFLGGFDKETRAFRAERVQGLDYGPDFYAPQTLEHEDGRRLLIAWMQDPRNADRLPEGCKWNGMMTIPRELTLKGGVVCQQPIRELEAYRTNPVQCKNFTINSRFALRGVEGRLVDLEVAFQPDAECERFSVILAADGQYHTDVIWDRATGTVTLDRSASGCPEGVVTRSQAPVALQDKTLRLRILLDRYSVEVFVGEGQQTLSAVLATPLTAKAIGFTSIGSGVIDVQKYELKL